MTRKVLTADAAEILGCSPSRVNQLVVEGTLPVLETVGKRSPIRVFAREVVEALAGTRDGTRAGRRS